MRRATTTGDLARIRACYAEGLSDAAIARVCDRSPDTVAYWRRKLGLVRTRKLDPAALQRLAAIMAQLNNPLTRFQRPP